MQYNALAKKKKAFSQIGKRHRLFGKNYMVTKDLSIYWHEFALAGGNKLILTDPSLL